MSRSHLLNEQHMREAVMDTLSLKISMGMNQRHVSAQERSVVGAVRVGGEMNAEDAPLLWGNGSCLGRN